MKFQFFHVDAQDPALGQERLNAFCSQQRVVSVEKEFVAQGGGSFWSVCVTYLEGSSGKLPSVGSKRDAVDYKEILNEQDFAMYADLRSLRKTIAEAEGVPAYALFTNRQLADMVTHHVISVKALGGIEGIGTARLQKYGEQFVQRLQTAFAERPAVTTKPTDETHPHRPV